MKVVTFTTFMTGFGPREVVGANAVLRLNSDEMARRAGLKTRRIIKIPMTERDTDGPGRLPGMSLPDYPRLKEKWLSCFLSVSKHQSMTLAAQQLGMTPRSLNRNLQELEKAIGSRLLMLNGRDKVLLLTEGLALLKLIQPLDEQLDALAAYFLQGPPQPSHELALGWCGAWPLEVLPRLLEKLCGESEELYPNIRRYAWAHELEEQVLAGEVALGLSCRAPQQRQLASLTGKPVPYVIVGAPQPPRPWHELAFVAGIQNAPGSFHGPWDDFKYPRRILLRAEGMSPILDFATSGLGAAWLPLCLVDEFIQQQQMAVIASPPQAEFLVPHLIWRADRELSPRLQRSRSLLQKYIESELVR